MLINPMINEEWKLIDFLSIKKNQYLISNFGRVFSYAKNGLLSPAISNGYLTVQLSTIDGKRRTFYIHRLVATAFVYNPDPDHLVEVNHKNFYRHDNFYENLEWVTKEDNIMHELLNKEKNNADIIHAKGDWGDGYSTYGENNGMAKLTEREVRVMLSALEAGCSYTEAIIAAGFEPTENRRYNLSHIARGHRWKYLQNEYKIPKYIKW